MKETGHCFAKGASYREGSRHTGKEISRQIKKRAIASRMEHTSIGRHDLDSEDVPHCFDSDRGLHRWIGRHALDSEEAPHSFDSERWLHR